VQGEDTWIAIACETDTQWQALANLIGINPLRYATASDRLRAQEVLDAAICAFTQNRSGAVVEAQLQDVGVPVSQILNSPELRRDPQLNHLGHFIEVPHHEGGTTAVEAARIQMSRSEPVVETSAPTFNRDMMFVLNDLLGYDDDKLGELLVSGALE